MSKVRRVACLGWGGWAFCVVALAIPLAFIAYLLHGAGPSGMPHPVATLVTGTPAGPIGMQATTRAGTQALALPPTSTATARPLPPTPYPYPTFRFTAGNTVIVKYPSIPFPAPEFSYMNEWRRIDANTKYELRAYAGGEGVGGDPAQGLLVLVTTTLYSPLYLLDGPEVYRTPSKVGPVQIVWADYTRLLVVAANDTAFLFDIATRRWLWPPNAQPPDTQQPAYQTRMQPLLFPSLPPLTPAAAWLLPDPTYPPQPAPTLSLDEIGHPLGAGRIIQGCENPRAGQPFLRENCWYEELVDGTQIGLGAGFARPGYLWATETGLIIVDGCPGDYKDGAYTRDYGAGLYETPRQGPPRSPGATPGRRTYDSVRIVGAAGERIHLVSQDGTPFVFDLASCHWVVPAVPTATAPPPTFTPVTPSPTALPWYAGIPPGDERTYVLKMEHLASAVLTAVARTPLPTVPPTPVPLSPPPPPPTAASPQAGA